MCEGVEMGTVDGVLVEREVWEDLLDAVGGDVSAAVEVLHRAVDEDE